MKGKMNLVVSLFSISLITMAAMNISPALSSIAAAYPEIPDEMIQLLITIPSFSIIFASLCSDFLAKRISVKSTVLLGAAIFTLAGTAPLVVNGYAFMLISRILIGLGLGIMSPLASTIIFKQFTDVRQRDNMIGWQGCASSLGNIITTILAGLLAVLGHKIVFTIHLAGLITFFCVLFLLPAEEKEKSVKVNRAASGPKRMEKLPAATYVWLAAPFAYMAFLHCFAINLSMFVEDSGIGNSAISGLGLSMLTVGSFFSGLFYGKISSWMKQYTMPIGIFISSVGLMVMALSHQPAGVYASGIITGFGMTLVTPVIVINVVGSAPASMTTFVIALNSAMTNLGFSVAPYTVTGVSRLFVGDSIRGRYYVCAAILFMMSAVAVVLAIKKKLGTDDSSNKSRAVDAETA